jgi:hypothetical protein
MWMRERRLVRSIVRPSGQRGLGRRVPIRARPRLPPQLDPGARSRVASQAAGPHHAAAVEHRAAAGLRELGHGSVLDELRRNIRPLGGAGLLR